MKNSRYIGALFLSPLVIFLFLGGPYLRYFILLISLLGMYEFYKVSNSKGIKPFSILAYIACAAYFIILKDSINFEFFTFLLISFTLISLCIPVIDTKFNFIDASITIIGFIYVAVFFSFIPLTNAKEHGNLLVWLIFIASWLCDTTAYYVGRYLGKNKICPKVSPKKTIEGSIGGLLGSTIACVIFGAIIGRYGVNIALYHYVIIGALCGVLCQLGDLVASSIKRHVGVKDYSNLIPGHGGILDRFDSILFASVVVYYYITFILGM